MRIVGGTLKGRTLVCPTGPDIRPTADRVRESLFNILAHAAWAPSGSTVTVADLFCGTGALGLEALSRGATHAVFVDSAPASVATSKQNAMACGVTGQCDFLTTDVLRLPRAPKPCDMIFMDPPYAQAPALIPLLLERLQEKAWGHPETLYIVESEHGLTLPSVTVHDTRTFGRTTVQFFQNL